MYPTELTDPIRAETRAMGLVELTTAAAVDTELAHPGTSLVFINSVCGCSAGTARPGLSAALAGPGPRPLRVLTVFAGVDGEATRRVRARFPEHPPSSPGAVLFRDGAAVWILHRHQIEGRTPQQVAEQFRKAFAAHC